MPGNLLLTGMPGVGKTTIMSAVSGNLKDRLVRGFLTEEIRDQGRRVGFALVPFAGERKIMAHRDFVSRQRVGRYGVDVEMIDYVVDVALSPRAPADLYMVDEIGKMECFSSRFIEAIRHLLDDSRPLVATVALRGAGLIADVKRRKDVELWEVSAKNRQQLPGRVADWLNARLS